MEVRVRGARMSAGCEGAWGVEGCSCGWVGNGWRAAGAGEDRSWLRSSYE